jgi:hypothetical protein
LDHVTVPSHQFNSPQRMKLNPLMYGSPQRRRVI